MKVNQRPLPSLFSSFLQDYVAFMNLKEGDTLGVFVTAEGDLHLTINEVDQGVAWRHLPTDKPLYAVINLRLAPTQISAVQITKSKHY